jgi:hypothetical protein
VLLFSYSTLRTSQGKNVDAKSIAGAKVERGRSRIRHADRGSPREKDRDGSASSRRSPKALGQDIATWSQQSSSAGQQWTGTGVALDRPVSHWHPRLSLTPALAASRFQNSLMRQAPPVPNPQSLLPPTPGTRTRLTTARITRSAPST